LNQLHDNVRRSFQAGNNGRLARRALHGQHLVVTNIDRRFSIVEKRLRAEKFSAQSFTTNQSIELVSNYSNRLVEY